MSNLSRRAFLSSLGIAAAAPSVVAKAIESIRIAAKPNPYNLFTDNLISTMDVINDGYWGSPDRYLILRSDTGKAQFIPIYDQPAIDIRFNG